MNLVQKAVQHNGRRISCGRCDAEHPYNMDDGVDWVVESTVI